MNAQSLPLCPCPVDWLSQAEELLESEDPKAREFAASVVGVLEAFQTLSSGVEPKLPGHIRTRKRAKLSERGAKKVVARVKAWRSQLAASFERWKRPDQSPMELKKRPNFYSSNRRDNSLENRGLAGQKKRDAGRVENCETVPNAVPVSTQHNARARIETKNFPPSGRGTPNTKRKKKIEPEWRTSPEGWASIARGVVWKAEGMGAHPFSREELAAIGAVMGAVTRKLEPHFHTWIYHAGQRWAEHWREQERPQDWRAGASIAGWLSREHEEGKFAC
jgi:hypothetical protein